MQAVDRKGNIWKEMWKKKDIYLECVHRLDTTFALGRKTNYAFIFMVVRTEDCYTCWLFIGRHNFGFEMKNKLCFYFYGGQDRGLVSLSDVSFLQILWIVFIMFFVTLSNVLLHPSGLWLYKWHILSSLFRPFGQSCKWRSLFQHDRSRPADVLQVSGTLLPGRPDLCRDSLPVGVSLDC